jgi:hypothetical protein
MRSTQDDATYVFFSADDMEFIAYQYLGKAVAVYLEPAQLNHVIYPDLGTPKSFAIPGFASVAVVSLGVAAWSDCGDGAPKRSTGVPGNLNCPGRLPLQGSDDNVVTKRPDALRGWDNFVSFAFKADSARFHLWAQQM